MKKSTFALLCLAVGFAATSCENQMDEMNLTSATKSQNVSALSDSTLEIPQSLALTVPANYAAPGENLRNLFTYDAVAPSTCGPTEFVAVQNKYLAPLGKDLISLFGTAQAANSILNLYMTLNQYSAYFDTSKQYFGKNGEYTELMAKRKRDLEAFWGMPNLIQLNGQHTATLNDREKLADVYEIVGANVQTREQAYAAADQLLYFNTFSPYLPESPFFALDGFATTYRNLIVIGDGIVEMLSETGVEPNIIWTGILAHEWAHQVQFKNMAAWYPNGAAADQAEATRYTELEADFMAAYYMTHKRGATYNSKRVEEFLTLFFQIGDCGFSSTGHHGTPAQRMAAARLGFELADQAQKQGHILTQQQVHEIFVSKIGTVI
ncbi:neutral zinc metallopeptidase [Rufibacter latericius]|uniref:Uncharacterized protein n=1 Tax=Rufibacter latericius TaxID=2487040 RepID=A0A3M9MJD3_9BACT|nr:hypothetical protein [Rufibacter latericius]RNI25672.1 hypothetical protein EFB08_12500 [Rufibacter latericius]